MRIVRWMAVICIALCFVPTAAAAEPENGREAMAAVSPFAKLKNRFEDVSESDWYYGGVQYANKNSLLEYENQRVFGPDRICTRAYVITALWRAAGGEEKWNCGPFLWAEKKGIAVDSSSDFCAPCSRADMVTYLWQLAGSPAGEGMPFEDVTEDKPYAQAVGWALSQKITGGMTETTFGPEVGCTRAQMVTFLYAALHSDK